MSKLCGGGGEVVYHSSVSASHGSLPARRPFRDFHAFQTKRRMPSPMMYEPIVEIRLYSWSSPVSS